MSTCPGCAEDRAFTTADIVWSSIDETAVPTPAIRIPPPASPAVPAPPPLRVAPKPKTVRRTAAPAPRSRRRLAGLAAGAVLVLALLLLVALPGKKASPSKPSTAAVTPPPSPPPSFAELRHRSLLERWKELSGKVDGLSKAPEQLDLVLALLESIERDGKGTEFEERARTSLRNVRAWAKDNAPRSKAPALRSFPPAAEIVRRAREALGQERVGDALFTLERQIDPRPDGAEKNLLVAEREAVLKKAAVLYDGVLAKAREEAVAGRLDEARARLRAAGEWGVPDLRERAYADAAALTETARAEREKRDAAARAAAEKARAAAIANYRSVQEALDSLRKGREADAARAADRAPTPEAKAAVKDLVAAWQGLWKLVESSIAANAKALKTLRFKDDTVAFPIKRVAKGEVVFDVQGGEYAKKLRDLVEPELLRQIPDSTPEGAAALALLALLAEDVGTAEQRLQGAGPGGAGVRAALGFAVPYLEATADALFAQADGAHAAKKCGEAALAYRKLSGAPSARLRALRAHARCSIELKSYTTAFEDVEKLVAAGVEPDDDLLAIVATAFERCTATDRVIETLKTLYRQTPGRFETSQHLALAFRRAHRYGESAAFMKQAVEQDPANWVFRAETRVLEELLIPEFVPAQARPAGRYRIFSTAGPAAAAEAASTLTSVYEEYARYFPPGRNEELPLYVRIFPDETSMRTWLQRLERIPRYYQEEFLRAQGVLILLETARSAGRDAVGKARAFFQQEPVAAATLDIGLLPGLSRWADRGAARVGTEAQLEAYLNEIHRLVDATFFKDVAYLDALLVLLGGDEARRADWTAKHRKSLETSLRESAVSTFGYLQSHNEDVKTKRKVDLQAVVRALDAAAGSNDLLRLAESKFYMTRLRLAVGNDEAMTYLLERMGVLARSDASARRRPGAVRAKPRYQDEPLRPLPEGVVQFGAYAPFLKELVLWRSDRMQQTLRHEAFHQFLDTYVDHAPPWFNEGFATVFEVSRGGKSILHAERQQELQMFFGAAPRLEELLSLSLPEFQASPNVSLLYAQSWSFIHWLISKGERWRLDRYFEALVAGRGADEAEEEAFGAQGAGLHESAWRNAAAAGRY